MTEPLSERVALITGAGRGIGRAVALRLAEAGARVALVARSVDQLEETAATLRAEGGVALVLSADLAHPDVVAEAAATAAKELGPVDILVNNAAVVEPAGPTVSTPPAGWSSAFAVNVQAPIRLTLALLPAMLDRGWGRIVNVSSGIVDHPGAMVGLNAYAATKAALEAHTLSLAAEVAGSGVTLNVYRPGSVGMVPRSATLRDRRLPAPAFSGLLRTGRADHPRALRTIPPHPTGRGGHRPDLERDRCLT